MRYGLLVLLLSGCGSFVAVPEDKRISNDPTVRWVVVDDAEKECVARGSDKPKPWRIITGCAQYGKYTCTIITNKTTTMETLGHELRHCFEGQFHSKNEE
jgi:hypothetical protein